MQKILSYFLRGLLLVAPVAITIYVLVSALRFVDRLVPTEIPGIGILIILTTITLVGAIGQTLLVDPLLRQVERLINKVPLAALIYSSVKDLLAAFVGDKRKFNQPVMVEMVPGSGMHRVGFITQEWVHKLAGTETVAVYFPDSYNISGELYLVPRSRVIALDWKSTEAMKFVVSGGVAYPPSSTGNQL